MLYYYSCIFWCWMLQYLYCCGKQWKIPASNKWPHFNIVMGNVASNNVFRHANVFSNCPARSNSLVCYVVLDLCSGHLIRDGWVDIIFGTENLVGEAIGRWKVSISIYMSGWSKDCVVKIFWWQTVLGAAGFSFVATNTYHKDKKNHRQVLLQEIRKLFGTLSQFCRGCRNINYFSLQNIIKNVLLNIKPVFIILTSPLIKVP